MKKNSGSRITQVFKRIVNVRAWSDFDRMKAYTVYLGTGIKKMFVPQKNTKAESFTAALKRLNISEQDLKAKQAALYRLSVLMCAFAALILCYTLFHLYYGNFKAVLVSWIVMLLALVLAFRYHFWYFQIKERKLGCSLKEWYRRGFLGDKK